MDVLVIGNGLDLSLGYATKYKDFLVFCEIASKTFGELQSVLKAKNGENVRDVYNQYISSHKELSACDLKKIDGIVKFDHTQKACKVISDVMYLLEKNLWIDYFQEIYKHNKIKGEDWVDIENEVENVIVRLENDQNVGREQKDGIPSELSIAWVLGHLYTEFVPRNYVRLKDKMKYVDFQKKLRRDYDKFIMLFSIYLDCFVFYDDELVDNKDNAKKVLLNLSKNPMYVICFNYKDNYSKFYQKDKDKDKTYYVHGKSNYLSSLHETKFEMDIDEGTNKNNMIIGFESDIKTDNLQYMYYHKFFQRVVKRTDNKYEDCFKQGNAKENTNVYIFGHSLDIADKDVLLPIFELENTKIIIYYYVDSKGQNYDLERKVVHLTRLLGRDRLVSMTNGKDAKIKFEMIK